MVKKETKREKFLARMEKVVPWEQLEKLLKPFYGKSDKTVGRNPYPLGKLKAPRQRAPRNNPKVRRVETPPPDIDLQQAALSCRYVGSPYHKDGVSVAGPSRRRPDASLCPRELINNRDRVQAWLRQAVKAGHAGSWGRAYPRYVWYRDQDGATIYEAREGSPGSGEYHGYPLQPQQNVQGLP